MRRTISAAVMSIAASFMMVPAASAGISPAPMSSGNQNIIHVQQRGTGVVEGNRGGGSRMSRGATRMNRSAVRSQRMRSGRTFNRGRHYARPGARYQNRRVIQRGFVNRGGARYYRGHRGYRHYRNGYRRYNGWWFPPAAFAAIVGGAIANSASSGSSHVAWCESHYRSYRASDNTFQPYHGSRRQCVSPYSN